MPQAGNGVQAVTIVKRQAYQGSMHFHHGKGIALAIGEGWS